MVNSYVACPVDTVCQVRAERVRRRRRLVSTSLQSDDDSDHDNDDDNNDAQLVAESEDNTETSNTVIIDITDTDRDGHSDAAGPQVCQLPWYVCTCILNLVPARGRARHIG